LNLETFDLSAGEAVNPIDALIAAPPPPRAGDDWCSFVGTVRAIHSGSLGWPSELERARLWYEPQLERIHEDFVARRSDLLQLEQIASGYPSRSRFLTELTLDPPQATSEQAGIPLLDEDYLILSTIHSAKGQKWKSVYVLNAVDGCIPSDLATGTSAEIEEAASALCRHDASQERLAPSGAATVFHAWPESRGRSAHLCFANALHSR
jgi:DNA helicase-2/ATP-dependent DNA helicase PcrA